MIFSLYDIGFVRYCYLGEAIIIYLKGDGIKEDNESSLLEI